MSNLLDTFLSEAPRERSGSVSSNRFDYQRSWALCHLLELHTSGADYVMILEYHDDVVVLDSEQSPTSVDLIQVKTSSVHWTEASLLSPPPQPTAAKKGAKAAKQAAPKPATVGPWSILGKLYDHTRRFGSIVGKLHLVSNAAYDLPLATGQSSKDRDKLCLDEVCPKTSASIVTKLLTELSHHCSLSVCLLNRTSLSVQDHLRHSLGHVSTFLGVHPHLSKVQANALHQALQDELKRRGNLERAPSSPQDLLDSRGLSRRQFQAMLLKAGSRFDADAKLADLKNAMRQVNMPHRYVLDFATAWGRYEIERMDPANLALQTISTNAKATMAKAYQSTSWSTLDELITLAEQLYIADFGRPSSPYDGMYLTAVLMWEGSAK